MAAEVVMTFEELAEWLGQKAADLQRVDLTQQMRVIAQLARSSILENFAKGQTPDGAAWRPLARPRQGKRHQGSSPLPLRDTGVLMASQQSGSYHVEKVSDRSLEIGSNLEYAGIHNFGGTINVAEKSRRKPWVFTGAQGQTIFTRHIRAHTVTIPARQFLGWSSQLQEDAAEVLAEALGEELT